jgi:hypothetical protein
MAEAEAASKARKAEKGKGKRTLLSWITAMMEPLQRLRGIHLWTLLE